MGNITNIDIFGTEAPLNKRWDEYQNGELLSIVYRGCTFGKFLKYFLDKFSSLTPDIKGNVFTDIGTAHQDLKYSGKIQCYFTHFINDNKGKKNLPICLILPTQLNSYLYLKSAEWFRQDDNKLDTNFLWQKELTEIENYKEKDPNKKWYYNFAATRFANLVHDILNLYDLKDIKKIPKFIIRDWYKKDFLTSIEKTYNYKWFKLYENHKFWKDQNVYHLPFESFFSYETFKLNIEKLSKYFNLQLDWNREEEMKYIFDKGFNLDEIRLQFIETFKILEAIKNKKSYDIINLSVVNQAYIYAELEKLNDFITMPLINTFYKNTLKICEYIEYYPDHYKAMNPNLPTFNGIPNPFYLHKREHDKLS